MRLRHIYFALFLVGTILPYTQFVPWFVKNGLDLQLFFSELFSTRVGGFFGMDAIVAAVVLTVFAIVETARLKIANGGIVVASVIAATLLVGGSSGFPLFLYLRQRHLDK